MGCLDIVRVIVTPCSSHSFGILMVGDDVVVARKLFMADWAYPLLLDNLLVQEFSHFCRRPQFPIPPRVMRIFNALDPEAQNAHLSDLLSATAQN